MAGLRQDRGGGERDCECVSCFHPPWRRPVAPILFTGDSLSGMPLALFRRRGIGCGPAAAEPISCAFARGDVEHLPSGADKFCVACWRVPPRNFIFDDRKIGDHSGFRTQLRYVTNILNSVNIRMDIPKAILPRFHRAPFRPAIPQMFVGRKISKGTTICAARLRLAAVERARLIASSARSANRAVGVEMTAVSTPSISPARVFGGQFVADDREARGRPRRARRRSTPSMPPPQM